MYVCMYVSWRTWEQEHRVVDVGDHPVNEEAMQQRKFPKLERTRATDWWGGEINKDTKRPRTLAHCAMLAYTDANNTGYWGPFL